MNKELMKNKLIAICQPTVEKRKQAIIKELNNLNIACTDMENKAIVCKSFEKDIIVLNAHYDVVDKSLGYNDNGMSLAIILNVINYLPKNVEVVFTNMEEWGGIGAEYYINNCKKNIVGCINLDCCGIGDFLYVDDYSFGLNVKNCHLGKMPFCDGDVFAEYKIPTLTFSTSYKKLNFKDGIREICKSIHNHENDNKIDLINFDLVKMVSDAIIDNLKFF